MLPGRAGAQSGCAGPTFDVLECGLDVMGRSLGMLGCSLHVLGRTLGVLWRNLNVLWRSLGMLGRSSDVLGCSLGVLGRNLIVLGLIDLACYTRGATKLLVQFDVLCICCCIATGVR